MSAPQSLLERLVPAGSAGDHASPARRWLDTHGLPTSRDEAWRYTPVDAVLAALDAARPAAPAERGITPDVVDGLAGRHGGPRLVFVNGRFARDASDIDALPAGLAFGDAGVAAGRGGGATCADVDRTPSDGFAALNELAGADAATAHVEAGVRIDAPLHVVHLAVPGEGAALVHPRTLVTVGRGASVDLVETFAGLGGTVLTNAATRIVADDSATVTYYRVQDETGDAVHVGHTRIDLAATAAVRATSIMVGASIARSALEARLAGPGATVDLRGLYMPAGHQRHDNVVTVDHAVPHCTSTQLFKGVVDGHGRGSFTGHVVVRPGAAGTDATQLNRNLVLQPTAQADTRPWLEILADDVRCNHGATVGRLADDALFYLRSRGIPLAESRALLVTAFAGEVIDTIVPPSLRDQIAAAFASRTDGGAP